MRERLYRSRKNRVFGGVAGGLAEYLNIDPVLARIIFVIVTFFNGLGLLLYVILWIVVPEEPLVAANFNQEPQTGEPQPGEEKTGSESSGEYSQTEQQYSQQDFAPKKTSGNGRLISGVILIGIGVLFVAKNFFPFFHLVDLFPIILVAVGIALIFNAVRN